MTRAAPTCSAPQSFAASCEDRTPPIAALAAEGEILGTLMAVAETDDEGDSWRAIGDLAPEDFYSEANRYIFAAACEIGEGACAGSIADRLRMNKRLKQCGGAHYLAEMLGMAIDGSVWQLERRADAVRDAYERRTLAGRCAEAIGRLRCGEGAASVAAALSEGCE